jgi:hypothetical protein
MTKIATDFPINSDVLKVESAQHAMWGRNRSEVTYNGAAATLELGTVLGKVTATGKYVVLAPAASDGSEVAAAVVIDRKVTAAATTDTKVVVLGGDLAYQVDVGVLSTGLIFPAGITGPQTTAALAALGAKGFQIITGVTDAVV